jgi:serine/threonine-protein kinase RsbW
MTVLKSDKLRVNTDIYQTKAVQQWFRQFDQIPHRILLQCELVLVEAFANVVYHAHEHLDESTPVDIEVILMTDAIEIRLWDFGQFFDLKQALADRKKIQDLTTSVDQLDIDSLDTGGRGLLITDRIADQLSYDRLSDGRNCLLVRKQLSPLV